MIWWTWVIPLSFIYYIICVFPFTIWGFLLPLDFRIKFTSTFWRGFFQWLLKVVFLSKVTVEDKREKQYKNLKTLIISNHLSSIDIPLLNSFFPVAAIFKKEILYFPLVGLSIWSSGGIALNRSDSNSRERAKKEAQRRLKKGISVQIYPEGTRSKKGYPKSYQEIKKSLLSFAYKENIPITPASLCNTEKILAKKKFNIPIALVIHNPLFPKDYTSEEDFMKAAWEKVENGFRYCQNICMEE